MNAIISPRTGFAVLEQKGGFAYIHADEPDSQPVGCKKKDLSRLLGENGPIVSIDGVSLDEARTRLRELRDADLAITLVLTLLDGSLSSQARAAAAEALNPLLNNELVRNKALGILYAHPCAKSADFEGALHLVKEPSLNEILDQLSRDQGRITDVRRSWDAALEAEEVVGETASVLNAFYAHAGLFHEVVLNPHANVVDIFQSPRQQELGIDQDVINRVLLRWNLYLDCIAPDSIVPVDLEQSTEIALTLESLIAGGVYPLGLFLVGPTGARISYHYVPYVSAYIPRERRPPQIKVSVGDGNIVSVGDSNIVHFSAHGDFRVDDDSATAALFNNMGVTALIHGDVDQARDVFSRALEILPPSQDEPGKAATSYNMGVVAQMNGDFDRAEARYWDALVVFQRAEPNRGSAVTAHQLGMLYFKWGRRKEAAEWRLRSLEQFISLKMAYPAVMTCLSPWLLIQTCVPAQTPEHRLAAVRETLDRLGEQPWDILNHILDGSRALEASNAECARYFVMALNELITREEPLLSQLVTEQVRVACQEKIITRIRVTADWKAVTGKPLPLKLSLLLFD